MYVKANSLWTLVDTENGRPKKVPQMFIDLYGAEPKIEMEYLERKFAAPQGEERRESTFVVKRHNIDTNDHVNNAQYVSMAMDYIKEPKQIYRLRAEYKKSALLNDTIYPFVITGENCEYVSLCDEDGKAFANILFDKG